MKGILFASFSQMGAGEDIEPLPLKEKGMSPPFMKGRLGGISKSCEVLHLAGYWTIAGFHPPNVSR
jgi:hypothetical protein